MLRVEMIARSLPSGCRKSGQHSFRSAHDGFTGALGADRLGRAAPHGLQVLLRGHFVAYAGVVGLRLGQRLVDFLSGLAVRRNVEVGNAISRRRLGIRDD
jgi:hypothetical protein